MTEIDDYAELHFRWEQCQFLIEALVLARVGLKKIPNRTASGKFDLMGKDMLSSQRQYEIRPEPDKHRTAVKWLTHDGWKNTMPEMSRAG